VLGVADDDAIVRVRDHVVADLVPEKCTLDVSPGQTVPVERRWEATLNGCSVPWRHVPRATTLAHQSVSSVVKK